MLSLVDTLKDECCIPYHDDILCFSKCFDDHIQVLCRVFQALQRYGVELKPEKCKLSISQRGPVFWLSGFGRGCSDRPQRPRGSPGSDK